MASMTKPAGDPSPEFEKRMLRLTAALGAYRRLAAETGDDGPLLDFMSALGRQIDAEVEAASEAVREGRMMSKADVDRHYRRLFPDEAD